MTDFSWSDNIQAMFSSCFPARPSSQNDSSGSGTTTNQGTSTSTAAHRKSISLCGWNLFGGTSSRKGRRGGAIQLPDSDEEEGTISLFGRRHSRSRRRATQAQQQQPRPKRLPRVQRARTTSSTTTSSSSSSAGQLGLEDVDSDADAPLLEASEIALQVAEEQSRREQKRKERREMKKLARVLAQDSQQQQRADGEEEFEGFPGSVVALVQPITESQQTYPYPYPRIPTPFLPSSGPSIGDSGHKHTIQDARRAEFEVDDEAFVHIGSPSAGKFMQDEDDVDADLGGGAYFLSPVEKGQAGGASSEGSGSGGRSRSSATSSGATRSPHLALQQQQQQLIISEKPKKKKSKSKSSPSVSSSSGSKKGGRSSSHKSHSSISASSASQQSSTGTATTASLASPSSARQTFSVPAVIGEVAGTDDDDYESKFPGVGFGMHARLDKQRDGWGMTNSADGGAFLASK